MLYEFGGALNSTILGSIAVFGGELNSFIKFKKIKS